MNLLMAFSEILKCLPLNDRQHSLSQQTFLQCRQNQIKNRTNVSNGIFIGKINLSTRVKQFSKNKIYNLKIIQMH